MCGFGSPARLSCLVPIPLELLRTDEAGGNVLDANSSLGDIQNEPKGVVIAEIDRLTAHWRLLPAAPSRPAYMVP